MSKMMMVVISLLCIAALAPACGDGGGGGSVDSDSDSDTDTDSDTDSDTDTDTDSDTDTDTDTDTDSDGGTEECADLDWVVEYNPINMLILLDRSQSMFSSMIGDATYAEVTALALSDIVETETATGLINFGLAVFPSMSCPAGGGVGHVNECVPANDEEVDPLDDAPIVPVGPDNFAAIDAALGAVGQCGGTPACESLDWALEYYTVGFPEDLAAQPKFVLLATDGAPNCNPEGDIGSCESSDEDIPSVYFPEQCLDNMCAYNAALQLASQGIKTFVIGVGSGVAAFEDVMQGIAYYAGGGLEAPADIPDSPVLWYPATDATSLALALEEITGEAIACTFTVNWALVPIASPDPPYTPVSKHCDKVNIFGVLPDLTEEQLQYSPDCTGEVPVTGPFGWRWQGLDESLEELAALPLTACTEIELCPEACNMLKEQEWTSASASFGCAPPPID